MHARDRTRRQDDIENACSAVCTPRVATLGQFSAQLGQLLTRAGPSTAATCSERGPAGSQGISAGTRMYGYVRNVQRHHTSGD